MGNIVLLDELTINKIAAGEVIERPASVVKELMENAIDAGATRITIEVKSGGIEQIKVIDNGKGMSQDDMEIAFERHATSKIRSADDLERVTSMGFRGEALASVAAISHVEMISKTQDSDIGNRIVLEAGNVKEVEETACSDGTTINITNLFFNTPVRYKFLKKDFSELGYIEDAVTRIALANPHIAIKLQNEKKVCIQTTGNGDAISTIYNIYGKDVAEGLLDVDYSYDDIRIRGVVGKPSIARGNRTYQMFYVNGRYIKDKTLSAAAEQAYKGIIPSGKFGFLILNIEIDPKQIDVNVHPAKLEIRFQEEQTIFRAIHHAINESLLRGDLVRNVSFEVAGKQEKSILEPEYEVEKTIPEEIVSGQMSEIEERVPEEVSEIEDVARELVQEEISETEEVVEMVPEEEKKSEETTPEETIPVDVPAVEDKVTEKTIIIELPKIDNDDVKEEKIKIPSFINMFKKKKVEEEEDFLAEEEENTLADIFNKRNGLEIQEEQVAEGIQVEERDNKVEEKTEEFELPSEEKIETMTEMLNMKAEEDERKTKIKEPAKKFNEMYAETFGKMLRNAGKDKKYKDVEDIGRNTLKNAENISVFEDEESYGKENYKYIGALFSTYVVIEIDTEIYIIDQHAAHERIMYEAVKEKIRKDGEKDSQIMLLPDIISLSHKERDIVNENTELFRKAGFIFEEFGDNTIRLIGVPTICMELDTKELFKEILDAINTVAITAVQEKEEKFVSTIACKAAIKANSKITKEEVNNLLKELLKLPNPFTCPHGRPTAIKMSKIDIERKFGRK